MKGVPEFAYHATRWKDIPKIVRTGLLPRSQPVQHKDEPRAIKERVIFFAPMIKMARYWGDAVVRFPWPEQYEEDWYGDDFLHPETGELVRSSNFIRDPVPPEYLEVLVEDRWVPIREWARTK